jgi:putative acetyltransferase
VRNDAALTIRPYRPADLDGLIEIFLCAVRRTASGDYSREQVDAWAQADRGQWAARRLGRPTWVALAGRSLAGFADLEASGHLDMMYVHPAHQNRGVASALLECAEAAARAQGLARIFTEASITARPFFERRGFRTVAANIVEVGGVKMANFRMEKLLGKAPARRRLRASAAAAGSTGRGRSRRS